ncbi:MAG: uncharacterized protein PWP51_1654 [Clostridiales bacterium]|jgi:uncharacterized protein (DUF2225 family)|nr:uncharacterized protein [Clostridiales bacterium]
MDTLFDRVYDCQVCDNTFKSKQVRTSAIRPKSRDKDFHAYYEGDNPTHYGIICCPYCGFAQFESDFKTKLQETDKEKIRKFISSRWHYQNFSLSRDLDQVIRLYMIALASYKVLGASYYTFGKIYLRLAWSYREAEDSANEMKYLAMAMEAFCDSYEKESHLENDMRELEITYMLGEINRQLGNYKEAVQWYDKAINHPSAYKNQMIKKYAREQWSEASDAFRNSQDPVNV